MVTQSERDYGIDNAKAVLIFLVVLGHIIERFIAEPMRLAYFPYVMIYSFHMPCFIFISGFLSRKENNNNLVSSLLVPYIILNLIEYIIDGNLMFNIFEPNWRTWYLLSLFFWRAFAKQISRLRFPITLSILLALYTGLQNNIGSTMSLSRTICFLPFFLLGYKMSNEHLEKIRNIGKVKCYLSFIAIELIIYFLCKEQVSNVGIFTFRDNYNLCGFSNLYGIIARLILIILSSCLTICFISVIPSRHMVISSFGSKTFYIYFLHLIIVKLLYYYVPLSELTMNTNPIVKTFIIILLTLLIFIFCSLKPICKLMDKILSFVNKLLCS